MRLFAEKLQSSLWAWIRYLIKIIIGWLRWNHHGAFLFKEIVIGWEILYVQYWKIMVKPWVSILVLRRLESRSSATEISFLRLLLNYILTRISIPDVAISALGLIRFCVVCNLAALSMSLKTRMLMKLRVLFGILIVLVKIRWSEIVLILLLHSKI